MLNYRKEEIVTAVKDVTVSVKKAVEPVASFGIYTSHYLTESIGLSLKDLKQTKYTKSIAEPVFLIEKQQGKGSNGLIAGEIIQFADRCTFHIHKVFIDKIALNDVNSIAGAKRLHEDVSIIDGKTSSMKMPFAECFSMGAERKWRAVYNRNFTENVTISETTAFKIAKAIRDNLFINSSTLKDISLRQKEAIILVDNREGQGNIERTFRERFAIRDNKKSTYKAFFEEQARLSCYRVLPNSLAILSDISVRKDGMTLAEFEDMQNAPVGYTPFKEFKVGEYEYKEALYRLMIDRGDTANHPLIYGYKIHVDINDVKDHGTSNIPAEVTKVYFNKHYYTPPEVVVTVAGGNGVMSPYILSTNKSDTNGRYFEVVLKNPSGQNVAGKISWASTGY